MKNMAKVRVIKCSENHHVFAACITDHVDARWKLQEVYYKAQGCVVETQKNFEFANNDLSNKCLHCTSLKHEFDKLIEEVIENN